MIIQISFMHILQHGFPDFGGQQLNDVQPTKFLVVFPEFPGIGVFIEFGSSGQILLQLDALVRFSSEGLELVIYFMMGVLLFILLYAQQVQLFFCVGLYALDEVVVADVGLAVLQFQARKHESIAQGCVEGVIGDLMVVVQGLADFILLVQDSPHKHTQNDITQWIPCEGIGDEELVFLPLFSQVLNELQNQLLQGGILQVGGLIVEELLESGGQIDNFSQVQFITEQQLLQPEESLP